MPLAISEQTLSRMEGFLVDKLTRGEITQKITLFEFNFLFLFPQKENLNVHRVKTEISCLLASPHKKESFCLLL